MSASVLFIVLIGIVLVLVLVLVHSLVGQFVVLSLMFVRSWPFVVVPDGVGIGDGVGGGMFVIVVGIVLVLVLSIRWLACSLSCSLMFVHSWRFVVVLDGVDILL